MSIEGNGGAHQSALNVSGREPARKGGWVRIIVYLALAAALGAVAWRIYQNQKLNEANSARQAAALMGRPIPVQVAAAEQRTMPIYLTALGTVTPYMSVTVKARVSGELLPVRFTEGQEVQKGQTIMVIDPRPYQAALDQAKGNLAHDEALLKDAKAEFDRYNSLYKAGVVSKEVMEADEATMGQYQGAIVADKAAVETAQLQLNWCYIQSPIDGRIGLRLVDPGNLISANTTNLVIINQFRPIAVYFTLPENELPDVLQKLAMAKSLPVDAYDRSDVQKIAQGELLAVDNQIDTTTGTARLKAVFANQNEALYPNEFVNVHLVLQDQPNALVVPTAAIQSGLNGPFVWVLDSDAAGKTVARIQLVKIAMTRGQLTILQSGIEPGQRVVVDGAERLRPGALVEASTPRSPNGQDGSQGPAVHSIAAESLPGSGARPGGRASRSKGSVQQDPKVTQ